MRRSSRSTITREPKLKAPTRRPGSCAITPRMVNGSPPMSSAIADRMPSCDEQLRPDQRAAVREQRVGELAARPAGAPSRRTGSPACTPRSSTMRATAAPFPSGGRTIVATSIGLLAREDRRACESRFSRSARTSGVHGRLVAIATSAAISARDSRVRPFRTVWIIERSATIAPTPIATQTKKNTSRRHDARISRHAISRTKFMIFRGASPLGFARRSCTSRRAVAQRDRLTSRLRSRAAPDRA